GAERVRRRPHVLDHLRAGLGEERSQLLLTEFLPALPLLDRARSDLLSRWLLLPPSRAASRNEAPVLQLDDIEDTLLNPFRVQIRGIRAQTLSEGIAPRCELLAH